MTTSIFQKKHAYLTVFTKNQGRTSSLPCSTGSYVPDSNDKARQRWRSVERACRQNMCSNKLDKREKEMHIRGIDIYLNQQGGPVARSFEWHASTPPRAPLLGRPRRTRNGFLRQIFPFLLIIFFLKKSDLKPFIFLKEYIF
jgi:hypothetical protein